MFIFLLNIDIVRYIKDFKNLTPLEYVIFAGLCLALLAIIFVIYFITIIILVKHKLKIYFKDMFNPNVNKKSTDNTIEILIPDESLNLKIDNKSNKPS